MKHTARYPKGQGWRRRDHPRLRHDQQHRYFAKRAAPTSSTNRRWSTARWRMSGPSWWGRHRFGLLRLSRCCDARMPPAERTYSAAKYQSKWRITTTSSIHFRVTTGLIRTSPCAMPEHTNVAKAIANPSRCGARNWLTIGIWSHLAWLSSDISNKKLLYADRSISIEMIKQLHLQHKHKIPEKLLKIILFWSTHKIWPVGIPTDASLFEPDHTWSIRSWNDIFTDWEHLPTRKSRN